MSYSGSEHWSEQLRSCEAAGTPYVLVTLLGARGSTPRESGTKMIVSAEGNAGTIGGGQLEHRVLQHAREMLLAARAAQQLQNFPLGEKLGQCCGGSTSVLFECFVPQRLPLLLFGAGHVGQALAPLLATLPLSVTWIDERADQFPAMLPEGLRPRVMSEPVDAVREAPAGAAYVIMTHQHPLDFAIAEAALRRGDAGYIGIIGSRSKWRRFALRFAHRGFSDELLAQVRCPIGLDAVPGKHPAEIAISVAAELVAYYHALRREDGPTLPPWKALRGRLEASDALAALEISDKPDGAHRPDKSDLLDSGATSSTEDSA